MRPLVIGVGDIEERISCVMNTMLMLMLWDGESSLQEKWIGMFKPPTCHTSAAFACEVVITVLVGERVQLISFKSKRVGYVWVACKLVWIRGAMRL